MSEVSKTPHNGQNTGGGQSEHDIRSIRREESIQAGKSADIAHDSKKSGALRELIVYAICGGLTTVVSFVVQHLLGSVISGERFLELRTIGSWVAAVAFAFVVNKLFVFRARSDGRGGLLAQIASFVGMRLISLGMEIAVISLGVRLCGGSSAVALLASTVRGLGFCTSWSDGDFAEMLFKLIGQALVVISNYFFSKFVIFRKKK